ncbi:hypothetical protein IU450_14495 [Nocardia abscessus]|uniref:hypothetical protein n=1 Tax=Nocardia abscessus TaxID=120957 RepID=UPI00189326FF|nr:hypothetical protein [Nocardia abscessus]MBF6337090.1 hypothetical protein [Nocardia abscessus]
MDGETRIRGNLEIGLHIDSTPFAAPLSGICRSVHTDPLACVGSTLLIGFVWGAHRTRQAGYLPGFGVLRVERLGRRRSTTCVDRSL